MYRILLIALLLAGCAQIPPSPQDIQAKKFEPVPGKAVIYVVRTPMDSRESGSLVLDGRDQITTLGGTYYRWEVNPGTHRVAGVGNANEEVTLSTAAGGIYFLEHTVLGNDRVGVISTAIRQISDQSGREMVLRSQLLSQAARFVQLAGTAPGICIASS